MLYYQHVFFSFPYEYGGPVGQRLTPGDNKNQGRRTPNIFVCPLLSLHFPGNHVLRPPLRKYVSTATNANFGAAASAAGAIISGPV